MTGWALSWAVILLAAAALAEWLRRQPLNFPGPEQATRATAQRADGGRAGEAGRADVTGSLIVAPGTDAPGAWTPGPVHSLARAYRAEVAAHEALARKLPWLAPGQYGDDTGSFRAFCEATS